MANEKDKTPPTQPKPKLENAPSKKKDKDSGPRRSNKPPKKKS